MLNFNMDFVLILTKRVLYLSPVCGVLPGAQSLNRHDSTGAPPFSL